jgi:hypothetical protein
VVVGEPRGATELERVTDIAGTPVIFEKDVCAVSYQGRGLLRRRHGRAALEQADRPTWAWRSTSVCIRLRRQRRSGGVQP